MLALRLMERDIQVFDSRFHDAAVFLNRAQIRYQAYRLAVEIVRSKEVGCDEKIARFRDLVVKDEERACCDTWFRDRLRMEFKNTVIYEIVTKEI